MKKTLAYLSAVTAALIMTACNGTGSTSSAVSNDNGTASGSGTTEAVLPKAAGWYMRTAVTATAPNGHTYAHNTAGVFGELDESTDGLDVHDIESMGGATLQVRFINDNLTEGVEYFSDYRTYENDNPSHETWTFLIKNDQGEDLSDATFSISVTPTRQVLRRPTDGKYVERIARNDLRDRLTLIDLDNGKTYTYNEVQSMRFSMDGKHIRTFRWVIGTPTQEDMQAPASIDSDKLNAMAMRSLERQKTLKASSKFGLPPSI
jgi:hypothetical protein